MNGQTLLQTVITASQDSFVALGIKATIALAAALLLLRLSRRLSASTRHLLTAATFGILFFLPLASALTPARVVTVKAPPRVEAKIDQGMTTPPAASPRVKTALSPAPTPKMDPAAIVSTVYLGGVGFIALTLLVGIWRLYRIRHNAEVSVSGTRLANEMATDFGMPRGIEVVVSSELAVPITFGATRPTILLPEETLNWSDEEMRRAVRHELEHIARGDWGTQILSRLAVALYWPNPLVWVLWSRLRLEAERACDDAVIRSDSEVTSYAEQLVSLARRLSGQGSVPALAMATRSNLGQRVESILDRNLRRSPCTRAASFSVAVLSIAGLLAIAPIRLMSDNGERVFSGEADVEGSRSGLEMSLLEASERGDLEQMRRLIDAGADADAVLLGDGSPLIAAARKGRLDAVRLLIDSGADVNRGVPGDGNPLTLAAKGGHLETVRLLLDRGADIDRGVPGDGNALIMAAASGRVDIVDYLLDSGASIDKVVAGDENALIHASESGQAEAVKLLIERGANVHARVWAEWGDGDDVEGEWRSPLIMARRNGHEAVVQILLRAGARE